MIPTARLLNGTVDGARLNAWNEYRDQNGKPRRAGGEWILRVVPVGTFRCDSGRIVVGDLGMNFDMSARLERSVPPGSYQVFVTIAVPGHRPGPPPKSGPDQMAHQPRTAYLSLRLRPEPAARFELASRLWDQDTDEDVDPRPIDQFPGFGVDSWYVGILDQAFLGQVSEWPGTTDYWDSYRNTMKARTDTFECAGMHTLPTNPPCEVPVCFSGWGSGAYLAYWGLSASGELSSLVIDFNLPGERLWSPAGGESDSGSFDSDDPPESGLIGGLKSTLARLFGWRGWDARR